MSNACIIAGTDTDVGKTVFAAMLMLALDANYWKPIQCGVIDGVDTKTVQKYTGLPERRFFAEKYILSAALAPHRAAEIDNVEINPAVLKPPISDAPLLIEAAGGLMVPLTRDTLQIDQFKRWNLPVILCARTGLGTLNHTLLSVEALKKRDISLHGIAFIGDENRDNMKTIAEFTGEKILGRLPKLPEINERTLMMAFAENFRLQDFEQPVRTGAYG
jgi:dethiobiotin synthase